MTVMIDSSGLIEWHTQDVTHLAYDSTASSGGRHTLFSIIFPFKIAVVLRILQSHRSPICKRTNRRLQKRIVSYTDIAPVQGC